MKRVLYFFPVNPLERNEGNKMRVYNLLQYFKSRKFVVDFVGQYNAGSKWSDNDIKAFEESGLANSVHILSRKPEKANLASYFFNYKIPNLIYQKTLSQPKGGIPDYTTSYLKTSFEALLRANKYDIVLISYASWAYLAYNNPYLRGTKTIIDTHDFLASQYQTDKRFIAGPALSEEIRRLNLFDEVWAISTDEQYFFSQFCKPPVKFVPMMVDAPTLSSQQKEYDLIYVASDNEHNRRSVGWFLKEVYPILPTNISICIIGKITGSVPTDNFENISLVPFAEPLGDYYAKSKIAICPMLSGTGIKVKVVEALSYGLPVVCTTRGIDGLPNKSNNGCLVSDDAEGFGNSISRLLENTSFYEAQSTQAKKLFGEFFEAEVNHRLLDKILA